MIKYGLKLFFVIFVFIASYCLSIFHGEVVLNLSAPYMGAVYVLMDEPSCLPGFVDRKVREQKIPYQIRNSINEQARHGFSTLVPDSALSKYISPGENRQGLISRLRCDFVFRMNPNDSNFWLSYVYKRNFLLRNDELIIWGEFKEGRLVKAHGVIHWGSK